MTPSKAFQALEEEFDNLADQYFPDLKSGPTPETSELARAFVVLCHAEIEFYLETISLDLANSAIKSVNSGAPNIPAISLLAFGNQSPLGAGDDITSGKNAVRNLVSRVGSAFGEHKKVVEGNNGIRESYMSKMFIPLGLTTEDIDPIWINAINAFANKRGAYAHKGRQHLEAKPARINPSDVYEEAERIIFGGQPVPNVGISSILELDDWYLSVPHLTPSLPNIKSKNRSWIHHSLWALTKFVDRYR
jgi:hypothetical protein